MTNLLVKLFVKNYNNYEDSTVRIKYGNFASIIGILCNLILSLSKGIIGYLSGSVAIIADAINNLSDVGNSAISLIGFLIAEKPSDKDHPYGHARIEYISCLFVSFVIILLGLSLFKTSVLGIIRPKPLDSGIATIFVLVFSILLKLWMGIFYKKIGRIIRSDVLHANSADSFNDVISTSAVLLCTLIYIYFGINLDGIAGLFISAFIIYSGISILKNTLDNLLGTVPDKEVVEKIVTKIKSYDGVCGMHDLVVHSYGPGKYYATVHLEVPANADILQSHDMIDNIERDFAKELNINLVIHLDPVITDDIETNELKNRVSDIVRGIDEDMSIHDFRMVKGDTHTNLIFDVVMPTDCKISDTQITDIICQKLKDTDGKLFAVITVDRNYISNEY